MSVVASYYTNDWERFLILLGSPEATKKPYKTHGWVSMLEGFSIFVNSEMEETLVTGFS